METYSFKKKPEINSDEIPNIVTNHFSRNQLREFALLRHANPSVAPEKLVKFLLLKSRNYSDPEILKKFGFNVPQRLSPMEEAKLEIRERDELEKEVISYFSYSFV